VEQFPSNSREPKQNPILEERDAEPIKLLKIVEEGTKVVRRKKPLGARFLSMFGGSDGRNVADYVVFDVLGPALKDMLYDAFTQGFERMMFGGEPHRGGRSRPGHRPQSSGSYTPYNRYAPSRPTHPERNPEPRTMSRRSRENHDFQDLILPTRAAAEDVLEVMFTRIERYHAVSVADLYQLVGEPYSHVDEAWGWRDLRRADVAHVSGGFLMNLPQPEPLN
jgi:hypothetical protein